MPPLEIPFNAMLDPHPSMKIHPTEHSARDAIFESLGRRLQAVGANLQHRRHAIPQPQLLELRKDLQELISHVDDLIKETPATGAPKPISYSTSNQSKEEYRCLLCKTVGAKPFTSNRYPVFKRHLMIQHFPSHEFHCPEEGCGRVYRVCHEFEYHFRTEHKKDPEDEEVDEARVPLKCPPRCDICARTVHDRNELCQCLIEHCLVLSGNSGTRSDPSDTERNSQRGTALQKDGSQQQAAVTEEQTTGINLQRIYELPAFQDSGLEYQSPQNSEEGQESMQFASMDKMQSNETAQSKIQNTTPEDNAQFDLTTTPFAPLTLRKGKTPTRPIPNTVDSSTSKSSQLSDDDSMQTNITWPDQQEDFDLDTGFADSEDMEHILRPGAYYRKLDLLERRTAEICGIEGPELQEKSLSECRESLQRSRHALQNLTEEGFCDGAFSILVRDQSRPDVANTVRISIHDIDDALCRVSPLATADGFLEFTSIFGWPLLLDLFGSPSPNSNWDQLEYVQFLTNALAIGLVAFSGSHVCRFDENLWGEELSKIPVGQGHSFSWRDLACLKDFVGGPACVLEIDQNVSQQTGLKVSLTVKDLQELWGPVWFMGGDEDEGVFLRTEAGYIIPLPRHRQTDQSLPEIECHWTSSYTGYETENPILLYSSSRILIGTGLSINEGCRAQINYLQARILPRLQPSGAHNAYHTLEGWDLTMQATMGSYVQAGGALKWKRNPARKWKTSIIEKCKYGKPNLRSLLSSYIGLEVSACTGNAHRVTLWDALRLSQTTANRQQGISPLPLPQQSTPCRHRIADPDCIQKCWTRLFSTDDIDTSVNIPPEGDPTRKEYLRRIIMNAIIALEDTGVDHDNNLQAYWPFTETSRTHRIEPSPSHSEINNWIRVIKDSRDVATFAVVSQRCMEAHHGLVRTCTMPCRVANLNSAKTTLYTRILLNPPFQSTCTENHDHTMLSMGNEVDRPIPHEHFVLGEAALTVQRIIPGCKNVVIATASGSAVKNGWMKMVKLGRRKMFQEDLDCDLSTGYYLPLLVQ
jgi:hypothetical protein